MNHIDKIAAELSLEAKQVKACIELLDEGATVPFISRYRKEVTGSLDEVQITEIRDRIQQLRELDKRKESIIKSIEDQEKMTPELLAKIASAPTMAILEDLYLPYKPKRKTRATKAREKGLEPLADRLLAQEQGSVEDWAKAFINAEKEVADADEALAGARDIIAEVINEDAEIRSRLRKYFQQETTITASVIPGKEEDGAKYKDYFEWSEPLRSAPSHRILAVRRAEKEGILSLSCHPDDDDAIDAVERKYVKGRSEASKQIKLAAKDAYKRLLKPSLETEVRLNSKKRADEEAINVFVENLRQLLLAAPLGRKNVLGIDPGFRTGCKVVCLDKQGKLLFDTVIYPNEPQKRTAESGRLIKNLCEQFNVEAVAVGNGTAGRETESFVRGIGLSKDIRVVSVNESGASVYSASAVAREEFPDKDLTVRGAVSIGRRLMDPLAELVKIDPKSIGVGQYQHDVDQRQLKKSLDDTVVSCVNAVGVELNTASKELLAYVSGLGDSLAGNIVSYRNENGAFKSRRELLKVSRLGEKAFEQAAGFLRIRDGKNPLDSSAVHPESYSVVEKMAKDLSCTVKELTENDALRKQIQIKKYVSDKVGLPTLKDIVKELDKPGRDPREAFEAFAFSEDVHEPEDLKLGMKLPGIVTNITDFGAFVDIGVHQDGLVHLSQLADRFISHPTEAVKVQQKVQVTVVSLDLDRNRIGLSMKSDAAPEAGGQGSRKRRPTGARSKKREEAPMNDMQAKLAALKNKFGK